MTMKRRDFLKKAGTGAGAVALGACSTAETGAATGAAAIEGPRVEWRLASSYPPSTDILYGVAERVATFKQIREVEFIDAIPKNPSGKILRRVLVEQERARA